MTNSAYDLLPRSRRYATQPLFPEDDEGEEIELPAWLADPSLTVQTTAEKNEQAKRLYDSIDLLPDVYRSVINLIDIHELDDTEVSRILNAPWGTVKSRLARAPLQSKERLQSDSIYAGSFTPTTTSALGHI